MTAGDNLVSCDAECEQLRREEQDARGRSREERKEEDLHNKREAEIFEKQLEGGKRKRRNRKKEIEEEEETFFSKNKILIISSAFLLSVIVGYSIFAY